MHLRGRSLYKLLSVLIIIGIIVFICINFLTNQIKRNDNNFLILLPPENVISEAKPLGPSNKLLNLTNFEYILKNDLCQKQDKEFLAILIITSYVGHDELRSSHRTAISKGKLSEMGIQRVFLLADIPQDEHFITQKQLKNEQERFNDLLQGNFREAYRNLSYKHVMGLRWAATECSRAKFIVKLDDDIVFDIFQLRRYLEGLEVKESSLIASSSLLAGYVIESKEPIRNIASKWYVSDEEYGDKIYPDYLSGWLYITNAPTALRLIRAAENSPIFWIDDTWITGLLRKKLNISMQRLNNWYSANSQFLECCVRDLKQSYYECEYFVGPNGGDGKLLVEFLHNVEKCYFDECAKRPSEKSLTQTCVASAKKVLPEHGNAEIKEVHLRR